MTIKSRLYRILIAPRQRDEDIRNRELVLNVLLAFALSISLLATLVLLSEIIFLGYTYLAARVFSVTCVTLYIGALYGLSRFGFLKTASLLLVGIYYMLALTLTAFWGVNVPTGILLYGLVIVLSGILLGPAFSLYSAGLVAITLTILVEASSRDLIHPDSTWILNPPGLVDVAGFSFIFGAIALVSWLFNNQMARSLHKAEEAEAALTKQKALLETTVEERTRELQAAQLEKVQQMYRFAELGQLSTAMMHDLANHLTGLTLNIESLEGKSRSKVLSQAKQSIHHIDEMVIRVRDQLRGRTNMRLFSVSNEIDEMVKMLRHRGQAVGVDISWQPPENKKTLRCRGDNIKFRQMIANLICNGFDAYYEPKDPDERREVLITLTNTKTELVIIISDWGRGIPATEQGMLFQPFHSTKQTGMGMGLFVVKQIVEDHFVGSVSVDLSKHHTAFVVRLPRAPA